MEESEFQEHLDLGPRVDIFFSFGFEIGRKAVGDFFRDVGAELTDVLIDLEIRAGDIERNVGAVDGAAEDHQIVGEDVFAIIGDEDAVAEELDRAFLRVEAAVDFWEEEDSFEIEGIVDIEVDPEKRIGIEGIESAGRSRGILFRCSLRRTSSRAGPYCRAACRSR